MKREEVYNAYLERYNLVSGGYAAPNWTGDGKGYWFVEGAPDDTAIMRIDLETGKTSPMVDAAKVRTALKAATGREPPVKGLPFETVAPLKDGVVAFQYAGSQWRLDLATTRIERAGDADTLQDLQAMLGWRSSDRYAPRMWKRREYLIGTLDVPEQLSPSREWFAGVRDNNIVLRATQDGAEQKLTTNGTDDYGWDIEALRWKDLAGFQVRLKSVNPWSPDSLTMLAYRRDVRGVFRMPRVNWLKQQEDVDYIVYQKCGGRLDRVEPVFIDLLSGRQTPVALGDVEDRFIQLLGWHPDSEEAILAIYPREFRRVDIVAASRKTGAVRSLLTEESGTFIKIQHEPMFSGEHGFTLLQKGDGFLWLSTRDGWNHLYHYGMNGRLIGQLSRGDWPIHEVVQIGGDGFVYFTASIDRFRPYDVHVCRVPLKGGTVEQLTQEKGLHVPTFSPDGTAFLDTHSSVDRPYRTDLVRADGTRLKVLSEMDISRLEAVGYAPAEEFAVKATDGTTDLWGVMYKPCDFDPSKKYPVIEYIYAGPQMIEAQRYFVVARTRFPNLLWALAQLGYIVVCLDARGTPGRSKAFHDAVSGNWTAGLADHAGAMRQLFARHAFMDSSRVGITGHSWGGYFSTAALAHAPDLYHAAVSYEPGYDVLDNILTEPYLGLPQNNHDAYERANLFRKVSAIKGKLMMIAGTNDHYVINTTMKMARALIDAGVEHELVIAPQAYHHYAGPDEDYLLKKLTGWFERHVMKRQLPDGESAS